MGYGPGTPVVLSGVVSLPLTGNNPLLFTIAVSLIALGVGVMVASMLIARKSRVSE